MTRHVLILSTTLYSNKNELEGMCIGAPSGKHMVIKPWVPRLLLKSGMRDQNISLMQSKPDKLWPKSYVVKVVEMCHLSTCQVFATIDILKVLSVVKLVTETQGKCTRVTSAIRLISISIHASNGWQFNRKTRIDVWWCTLWPKDMHQNFQGEGGHTVDSNLLRIFCPHPL